MTLIVKELVIRGIVTTDHSAESEKVFEKEELVQFLEQMKREIERECTEQVLQKIESKTLR